MKHQDAIVEELHKLREQIGRAHGFDADRIADTIRQHERERRNVVVRARPRRVARQVARRARKAIQRRATGV